MLHHWLYIYQYRTLYNNQFYSFQAQTMDQFHSQFNQNAEEGDIFHIGNYPSPSPSQHFSSSSLIVDGTVPINQFNVEQSPHQTPKGARKYRKASQQPKNMNRGHWSTQQNKKYHWFLQIHYQHFVNRHMRRMDKIFKTMEIFVGTRQAEQCRSHHQKMQKKYLNFITIICNLRQQHYNSLDIEPILEDMTVNSISSGEGLATIDQLRLEQELTPIPTQLKQRKKSTVSKVERKEVVAKQQEKCEMEREEEHKMQQINNANMLDQSNLNIGQLALYHEKDDNSYFFNSIFKTDL